MSKNFQIIWAKVAEDDLKEIIRFIARESQGNALKIFRKIMSRASSLYTVPERGRAVPELQAEGITIYRELIIPPWRIIFRISNEVVYVLSVLDARRNVEDTLLKRLINF